MIEEIRASIVARARSYVGCSARPGNPGRDRYRRIICPNGPTSAVDWLCQPTHPDARESSCVPIALHLALVVELWERGLPQLQEPFDGAVPAWARAVALARAHGALCTMQTHPEGPGIGAIVHVDGPPRHWFTRVDAEHSVDGGQNDGGYQAIHLVPRRIQNGRLADGRPVIDWIDAPLLVARLLEQAGKTSPAACSVAPPAAPIPQGSPSTPSTLTVIDVSSVQPSIDGAKVARAGVAAVYARAMIGRDDVDTRLVAHAAATRGAGLPLGVYGVLYPRHGRPQDADVQARQLAAQHRRVDATLEPMVDVEDVGRADDDVTGAEWLDAIRLYVNTLRAEGLNPILYTGPAWWSSHPELVAAVDLAKCPLWLAAYVRTMPPPPRPWMSVRLWQRLGSAPGYTGRVEGVTGPVDVSTLFGSLDILRATPQL